MSESPELEDPAGPRTLVRGPVLLTVVAFAGAATMVVELGAVRLLSPWFGTSSRVWTNVIGVVLAALALGYALGARLARSPVPTRTLGIVLLLGAAMAGWLPLAAKGVAAWFMPDGVALHEAADVLVWGSLAASVVLFLPAATALGAAGPLAVEALQRERGGHAGAAGGRVLASSTLGSLAGTFGTTHVFIPSVGVTATFLGAAIVLGACAAVLLMSARAATRATAPLVIGGAFALGLAGSAAFADARGAGEGETMLGRAESSVQTIRVVETGEGDGRMRYMRVNESLDSFQSVWQPEPGLLPPGHYYNQFALPYAWARRQAGAAPERWDVLVIGLGAGTAVRVLDGVTAGDTELRTVGIEIDGAVLDLAEEHFEFEADGEKHVAVGDLDGRAALRVIDRTFDQVIVDAYANNMEIPAHLATVEAFAEIREKVAPGGWVSINVGGFGPDDPVVRAVASAAAIGLDEEVHIARVPFSRNMTVFARLGAGVPTPLQREFGAQGEPLVGDVQSLVAPLAMPGAWTTWSLDDARPFAQTDDRAATEALQVASIEGAARRLEELDRVRPDEGTLPLPTEVAQSAAQRDEIVDAAAALVAEGDYVGALQAIETIERPTTRANEKARLLWRVGDPFGALEVASEGLRFQTDGLDLLRTAIDLGTVVGAGRVSADRLERLRGAVDLLEEAAQGHAEVSWWRDDIERMSRDVESVERRSVARRTAVGRARLALVGALVVLAVGFVGARRVSH